jgi:flagellar basal body-associated protein FliL
MPEFSQNSGQGRRPFGPTNLVVVALLVLALAGAGLAFWHIAGSAVGRGPSTAPPAAATTVQDAKARSQGRGREGSNPSQDAYTSQNQSRDPTKP